MLTSLDLSARIYFCETNLRQNINLSIVFRRELVTYRSPILLATKYNSMLKLESCYPHDTQGEALNKGLSFLSE